MPRSGPEYDRCSAGSRSSHGDHLTHSWKSSTSPWMTCGLAAMVVLRVIVNGRPMGEVYSEAARTTITSGRSATICRQVSPASDEAHTAPLRVPT